MGARVDLRAGGTPSRQVGAHSIRRVRQAWANRQRAGRAQPPTDLYRSHTSRSRRWAGRRLALLGLVHLLQEDPARGLARSSHKLLGAKIKVLGVLANAACRVTADRFIPSLRSPESEAGSYAIAGAGSALRRASSSVQLSARHSSLGLRAPPSSMGPERPKPSQRASPALEALFGAHAIQRYRSTPR